MFKKTTANVALLLALTNTPALAECLKTDPGLSDFPESLVSTEATTGIQSAWYDDSTQRYAHGVLGDINEPSTLVITDNQGCAHTAKLEQEHVFEDLAPRLANLDDTAGLEVITIRSHRDYGAQLAVYTLINDSISLLTTTPYIGTSNRWLAPVGIADFNNDGDIDIAFVDRPHLAKTLRVWSYRDGKLEQIASRGGYSNHRIGEDFISGGIKTCDGITTMITADNHWDRVLETTLENNQLTSRDVGSFNGADSLDEALLCN